MTEYKTGQKWISTAEPELGIGRIAAVEHRFVTVAFDLIDEVRTYAKTQAPLTRVQFNDGDSIKTLDGIEMVVTRVSDKNGILVYHGDYAGTSTAIIETDLDPNVTFSKPEERLFTHQIDDNRWFNLRYETLSHRARLASSPVKGMLGPRVSLVPHQFYIASEVARRYAPRVLLADEVGLGKTIEAGLIIHQQLVTGRAQRIMVIVPPALNFQWFVEMIRRFNLQFTMLNEDRCQQIESDNRPEFEDDIVELDNPFDAQQLVLCSMSLFLDNPKRLAQAADADWDLIVVDEAHHLHWENDTPGEDYLAVEELSRHTRGLLLLTATPEQLGRLGHFSRLRLLDATRYHDYEIFLSEEKDYESIASLISELDKTPAAAFADMRARLGVHAPESDDDLIPALLDRHGTGRVLFRNVRESVSGFKQRKLHRSIISVDHFPGKKFPDKNSQAWNSNDARIPWLIELIAETSDKFLVICSEAATAMALEKYLSDKTPVRTAAFHEGLDLVARDRAANYFADQEKGAQILVCSEIGSEGRNFQFAHQLVMYDLPMSPDLLEQRIGRLDRIGQKHDITIHVPFAPSSEQEFLLRLFDEGLSVFTQPNAAAQVVFDELPDSLSGEALIVLAKQKSDERLAEMNSGRDRLLELNSHRPIVSSTLINAVRESDGDQQLEAYMEQSFEAFGLESEPLAENLFCVKPTETMVRHSSVSIETQDRYTYPELSEEGLSYTYDRATALAREDVHFLTWENPLVEQAMDLVASDVTGNSAAIVVKMSGVPVGTLLVETLHLIECVAPSELNASAYLPPSLVRCLTTPLLQDFSEKIPFSQWSEKLEIPPETISKIVGQQEAGIKKILAAASLFAKEKFVPIRQQANKKMESNLTGEIKRMKALAELNPNIRQDEIAFMEQRHQVLSEALQASQIRLEAIRIIITA